MVAIPKTLRFDLYSFFHYDICMEGTIGEKGLVTLPIFLKMHHVMNETCRIAGAASSVSVGPVESSKRNSPRQCMYKYWLKFEVSDMITPTSSCHI